MCGIFGVANYGGIQKITVLEQERLARKTLKALSHRGPNDEAFKIYSNLNINDDSYLILGHTRLSILDLTSSGHQPMCSSDERYTIIFNGEIYNYKELKSELEMLEYRFFSNSDTEVLLNAWREWGINCLSKLIGMFAFVVYDALEKKITCARDQFGIKPFFYTFDNGVFSFASEIPALVKLVNKKYNLNYQRCYDYLVHGDYDYHNETFFEGVVQLMQGTYLEYDFNQGAITKIGQWYEPNIIIEKTVGFEEAVLQVRHKFLDSIRLHLRSDVAVGAALSGGIDSSSIVCAMRYIDPLMTINTFSYVVDDVELNEEHWIDLVNRHVGAIPHKIRLSSDELLHDMDDLIMAQGEPFGSTSIYAQYRVYKLSAANGVKVTLDGQGADEMLAGYNGYPGHRILSLIEIGKFTEAFNFICKWSKWPGRSVLLAIKYFISVLVRGGVYEFLIKFEGRSSTPKWINRNLLSSRGVVLKKHRFHPRFFTKGRRLIDELSLSLFKRGLNILLRHGDRNSMAFGVESRVPFLTDQLVSYLLSLPENYLISNDGRTKHVFREAMRGIVPDEILDRKDKIGFDANERELIIKNAPKFREWLVKLDVDFINTSQLLSEFDLVVAGRVEYSRNIWRWIIFARWKMLMN